jgi:PPM family protein phosphatase
MEIKYYTEQGTRENNEDMFGCFQVNQRFCVAIADGLGGHGSGEIASKTAIKTVKEIFENSVSLSLKEQACLCFEKAQEAVMEIIRTSGNRNEYKTTLVLVIAEKNKAIIGHIGDSRCYLARKSKIYPLTKDHSVSQMLVNMKEIQTDEIRNHPDRNKLLRVIGVEWNNPRYEIDQEIKIEHRDKLFLCSDGVWENFSEKELEKILTTSNTALEEIRMKILNNGRANDNNTAICITY